MSILGVDIGNYKTVLCEVKNGKIKIIPDNTGQRLIRSILSITNQRYIGNNAKNLYINNETNVYNNFKQEKKNKENIFGIFLNEVLKNDLIKNIINLVITVPHYYNIKERFRIIHACNIMNIKNPILLDENLAVALNYGILKIKLNEKEEKNIIFIDICEFNTIITIVNYNKKGFQVLDINTIEIGGNYFTNIIYNYLYQDLLLNYKYDINKSKPKYRKKLFFECDKIKKNYHYKE